METPQAVTVENLVKNYGSLRAVDGISFQVREGDIFGLLGPNGAGKTTTLEMLEGLRQPDSGRALVAGVDIRRQRRQVQELIGVQLQEAGFFEKLTVRETLQTFGAFHRRQVSVDALLARLNLDEKAKTQVENLSGGQKQRLSIALALLNDPHIVFLDEPTTGLDPQARRNLWDVIRQIRDDGRTVVLTTHYMEEAEELCDRIAIMDHGRIIAEDTPQGLIQTHATGGRIYLEMDGLEPAALDGLAAADRVELQDDGTAGIHSSDPSRTLMALIERLNERQVPLQGLRVEQGTLEDVFLNLTGKRLRD